jgi:cellulose synthase/poly-beta-1,6-N-acetylglucosamine synthase-like glycosyltransferase
VPKLPNSYLGRLQACEYIRSFVFGRTGWNLFKGAMSYSGTCTLFERDAVLEIGGFDTRNPAQDAEIIAHLHKHMREKNHPYNILFTPVAFAWTEVPDTFKSYTHQRIQWQWGLMQSFLRHVKMLFNPFFGITGLFTYPFYLLVESFGHIIELLTYLLIITSLIFGFFDAKSALIFFLLSAGFLSFLTVATMLLNIITFNKYRKISDILRIFFYSIIEMFGFRQYSLIVRTIGTIKYFFVGSRKKQTVG